MSAPAHGARIALVAAMASTQGKTSVTAALARSLVRAGQRVRLFRCGPDFIDPMLLERACGSPVDSLDLWMVGLEECRRRLAAAALEADVVLVEGVMGLYDGTPSAADLARAFGIPVVAVIDASAMAQTAGAVARGLRGHTFHYSRLETPLAPTLHTVRHPSGAAGEAVYRSGSLTASYFHGYFPSNPAAAASLFAQGPW